MFKLGPVPFTLRTGMNLFHTSGIRWILYFKYYYKHFIQDKDKNNRYLCLKSKYNTLIVLKRGMPND